MHRGNRRLQRVGAEAARAQRALHPGATLGNLRAMPPAAILCVEQHQLALGRGARRAPRFSQQHQRQQALRLGFGQQLDQQPAKADGFVGEVGPRQRLAVGGEVALVENQVDHPQHAVEPRRQRRPLGHFVGDARVADLALGAHDALRQCRCGSQEGAGDGLGGQAAHFAQGQRHLRLGRERRMAAGEDQPQAVVLDAAGRLCRCLLLLRQPPGQLGERGIKTRPLTNAVDSPKTPGRHQPGARVVRHSVARPLRHGRDEGLLHRLLRQIEIAQQADQRSADAAGVAAIEGVDVGGDVGGCAGGHGHLGQSRLLRWLAHYGAADKRQFSSVAPPAERRVICSRSTPRPKASRVRQSSRSSMSCTPSPSKSPCAIKV